MKKIQTLKQEKVNTNKWIWCLKQSRSTGTQSTLLLKVWWNPRLPWRQTDALSMFLPTELHDHCCRFLSLCQFFSLSVRLSAARKAEWWMRCKCRSLAAVGVISILLPSLLPSLLVPHSSLSYCVANIEWYESPACARRLQQQQPKKTWRREGEEGRGERGETKNSRLQTATRFIKNCLCSL